MSKAEFQKLRRLWYAKIKKAGFQDIESSDEYLRKYSSNFLNTRGTELGYTQAKADYYYYAGHFIVEYKFESKLDQVIWEYHANGFSIRNIVKLLKKVKIKTNRDAVHNTLRDLRQIMKKKYFYDV